MIDRPSHPTTGKTHATPRDLRGAWVYVLDLKQHLKGTTMPRDRGRAITPAIERGGEGSISRVGVRADYDDDPEQAYRWVLTLCH